MLPRIGSPSPKALRAPRISGKRLLALGFLIVAQSIAVLALLDYAFGAIVYTSLFSPGARIVAPLSPLAGLLFGFLLLRRCVVSRKARVTTFAASVLLGILAFLLRHLDTTTSSLIDPLAINARTLEARFDTVMSATSGLIAIATAGTVMNTSDRLLRRFGLFLAAGVTMTAAFIFFRAAMQSIQEHAWNVNFAKWQPAAALALFGAATLLLQIQSPASGFTFRSNKGSPGVSRSASDSFLGKVLAPLAVLALALIWLLPRLEALDAPWSGFFAAIAAATCVLATHALNARVSPLVWVESGTLLDTMAIAATELDGRIIYWSSGCQTLYGWTAREAIGQPKRTLTAGNLHSEEDSQRVRNGEVLETELTEFHRDGYSMKVRETCQLLHRGPGEAPIALFTMVPVEPSAVEPRELSAPRSGLSQAETLQFAIIEWRAKGDKLSFHGPVPQVLGFAPGCAGQGLAALRTLLKQHLGFAFPRRPENWREGQHDFTFQTSPPFADRRLAGTVLVRGSIAGGDLHVTCMLKEASDREHDLQRLQAREAELRTISETVPEALVTIDTQGCIRSFSSMAQELFGYGADEIVGQDIRLVLPDFVPNTGNAPQGSAGTPTALPAMKAKTRSGQDIPVTISIGLAHFAQETISVLFIQDLSDHLATQARINQLNEQFDRVSRASELGELSAMIAHELNQPLNAASNFLSAIKLLVERDRLPESMLDLAELARNEVLRASDIIQGIRQFITHGEFNLETLRIDEFIRRISQLEAPQVNLDLNAGPQAEVDADPVQINQVLTNLVTNAVQAANTGPTRPEQTAITIATMPVQDGLVRIRVSDNGPGFPQAYVARPFEPFRTEKVTGMGLGLSYCQRVISAHGGTMTLRNGHEGGAQVEFTLPVHSSQGIQRRRERSK